MSQALHTPSSSLDPNWVTTGILDFEFKKYILLDYLQKCHNAFHQNKLYPPLSELCLHYKNLHDLQAGLTNLEKHFHKELTQIDIQQLLINYESTDLKHQEIETIQEIIAFAIPSLRETIAEGKDIYECIEQHLEIQPVGVVPLHKEEGYMFIHTTTNPEIYIYRFQQKTIVQHFESYRQLAVEYVTHTTLSLAHTLESIKLELIRSNQELPQPATFDCACSIEVPMHDTLIPIAKRAVLKHLSQLD
ncbi:MAG: hypothetical protein RLZZ262_1244 [Bacteroidota bacterium]|jgi:hypothetical protein